MFGERRPTWGARVPHVGTPGNPRPKGNPRETFANTPSNRGQPSTNTCKQLAAGRPRETATPGNREHPSSSTWQPSAARSGVELRCVGEGGAGGRTGGAWGRWSWAIGCVGTVAPGAAVEVRGEGGPGGSSAHAWGTWCREVESRCAGQVVLGAAVEVRGGRWPWGNVVRDLPVIVS